MKSEVSPVHLDPSLAAGEPCVHLALAVSDLDRSIGFYERLLGSPPQRREPGYARFVLTRPGLVLALIESQDATGLSHAGLRLTGGSELESARERLANEGLETREETATECCYARADKLWLSDPDGVAWELYRKLGEGDRLTPTDDGCCSPSASACCEPEEDGAAA